MTEPSEFLCIFMALNLKSPKIWWEMYCCKVFMKNENFAERIRVGVTLYCLFFFYSSLRNVTTSSSSATAWNTTQCPPTGWPWGLSSSLAFCHCHALLPYSEVGISDLLSALLAFGLEGCKSCAALPVEIRNLEKFGGRCCRGRNKF